MVSISPVTVTVVPGSGDQHDGCSLGSVNTAVAKGSQTPEGHPWLGGWACLDWGQGETSSETKTLEAGDGTSEARRASRKRKVGAVPSRW